MQSTLHFKPSTSSHHFSIQWRPPKSLTSGTPNLPSQTLTLACSLRTRINYDPEGGVEDGQGPANPAPLPVVVRRFGRVSRYFWDGSCLQLVNVDGGASSFRFGVDDGLRSVFRVSRLAVRDFFIPKSMGENYMEYVKWKFLHRVFSSALQVLATQAMFRAIGFGSSRSLPSAAAFNWVMKDGLGRLSRCIFTARFAYAFDTNLKRVRFSTSVLFTLSIGIELLTPAFPQSFLILASLANIAKQISRSCYLATSSAIHRSFAIADNLGEVSAKAQIQSVCFDNLGLMLAAALDMLFRNNQRLLAGLPFVLYPFFSAIDLFGIYQGLKHVHLQTLTKDRLEIILDKWIAKRYVPSPKEVCEEEGISLMPGKSKELWPIRIGCLNPKVQIPKLSMLVMQSLSNDDNYFICVETIYRGLTRTGQLGIVLCFREGAHTADVIMGLLQACRVREILKSSEWEGTVELGDSSETIPVEWVKLIDVSKLQAQREFSPLNEQMSAQNWAVKNILLNIGEQARYSYVVD